MSRNPPNQVFNEEQLDQQTQEIFPQTAIFAGEGAIGADIESLSEARALFESQIDPREIWARTGWYRGRDGAWRWEIDDSSASFQNGVFNHSALEQAYPGIFQRVPYSTEDMEPGLLGYFSPTENRIAISNSLSPEEQLSTLLHEYQHAIQREEGFEGGGNPIGAAIRRPDAPELSVPGDLNLTLPPTLEGMSWQEVVETLSETGWRPDRYTLESAERSAYPQQMPLSIFSNFLWNATLPQIESFYGINFSDESEEIIENSRQDYENYFSIPFLERPERYDGVIPPIEARFQVARTLYPEVFSQFSVFQDFKEHVDSISSVHLSNSQMFDIYERLYGEAEARSVQTRRHMEDWQRRLVFPRDTFDVPYEGTFINPRWRFNQGGLVQENFDWHGTPEQWDERDRNRRVASGEAIQNFRLPMWANPNRDLQIGQDELGNPQYLASNGTTYILPRITPEMVPASIGPAEMARRTYEAIPPMEDWRLPTGEELGTAAGFVGDMARQILETPTNPDASLADVWDVAGMAMTGGLLSEAPEGALRSGLSRSRSDEVPMFRERTSEQNTPQRSSDYVDPFDEPIDWKSFDLTPPSPEWDNITYRQWNFARESDELPTETLVRYGLRNTEEDYNFMFDILDNPRLSDETTTRFISEGFPFDAKSDYGVKPPLATFRSPISEVVDTLQVPRNGMKGSEFLRALEQHPDIRASEIRSLGLEIDPQRRYSQEELREAVASRTWNVVAEEAGGQYSTYQRQQVLDRELDYQEIVIRANRGDGLPTFDPEAGSGHFGRDVLAHARVSIRQPDPDGPSSPDNRPYILIEELQSDLVQRGWARNSASPPVTNNKEFTEALIESVMAYAQRNNVDEIVFPPFEQIVARRFNPDTDAYEKAMKPSSGFSRTYINGVNAFIEKLQREFGNNRVSVRQRELPYDESGTASKFSRRQLQQWVAEAEQSNRTLREVMPEEIVNWMDWNNGRGWEPDLIEIALKPVTSTQGISVNISGISNLDLSRPRFAQGGLVTQTQEAFRGLV